MFSFGCNAGSGSYCIALFGVYIG